MIFLNLFFEKKIRGFYKGEVLEIRDVVLTVIRPPISLKGLRLAFDRVKYELHQSQRGKVNIHNLWPGGGGSVIDNAAG